MSNITRLAVHYSEQDVFTGRDLELLEKIHFKPDDMVNIVLLVWEVFQDNADRIYEVVIDEIADVVTGSDIYGGIATALGEYDSEYVQMAVHLYHHLHPSLKDMPLQFHDAVREGLRQDLSSGAMHVLRHEYNQKLLVIAID